MTSCNHLPGSTVIVGADTHRDEHVAVAVDQLGARLGQHRLHTTRDGYEGLHCWATSLGEISPSGLKVPVLIEPD